jgi:hypothetical protein
MALASAIRMSKECDRELHICWKSDYCFTPTFDTLFQPISFKFVTDAKDDVVDMSETITDYVLRDIPEYTFLLKRCHFFCYGRPYDDWSDCIRQYINPVQSLLEKINSVTRQFSSKTIGVHIRKGDKLTGLDWRGEGIVDRNEVDRIDDRYIDIMKQILEKDPSVKFFVATEDLTIDRLRVIFKDKIVFFFKKYNRIFPDHSKQDEVDRCTQAIQDAVVDLWCLSKCSYILRGLGTFGMFAAAINNTKSANIFSPDLISFTGVYKDVRWNSLADTKEIVSRI